MLALQRENTESLARTGINGKAFFVGFATRYYRQAVFFASAARFCKTIPVALSVPDYLPARQQKPFAASVFNSKTGAFTRRLFCTWQAGCVVVMNFLVVVVTSGLCQHRHPIVCFR